MKGDVMSIEHKEDQPVKTMDIKRLIEASSNNMLSELSYDCQEHEQDKNDECIKSCLSEMKLNSEKQANPNNPFHTC